MEIQHSTDNTEIYLHQQRYIEKIAFLFGFDVGKDFTTPMEEKLHLEIAQQPNDDSRFRALIGALLYVAKHTRPDIYYPVNKLS